MYLNNQYQIGCQPMVGVGSFSWITEMHYAGITPGIPWHERLYTQIPQYQIDRYFDVTNNLIVSATPRRFRNPEFQKFFKRYKPSNLELVDTRNSDEISHNQYSVDDQKLLEDLIAYTNTKVHCKNFNPKTFVYYENVLETIHGVNVKNNLAAGTNTNYTSSQIINYAKQYAPEKICILSGGIVNKADVDKAFAIGADVVLAGTIFALADESPVSLATKEKILASDEKVLQNFGNHNLQGIQLSENLYPNDSGNMDKNLINGIRNANGIIYAGDAIHKLQKKYSIKQIVKQLVS